MNNQKNRFWTFVLSLVPGGREMYFGLYRQGVSLMLCFWALFIPSHAAADFRAVPAGPGAVVLQLSAHPQPALHAPWRSSASWRTAISGKTCP